MYKINKRGQSTVEYVLLVTAVIAVMIAFTTNQNSGGMQSTLTGTLNSAYDQVSTMAGRYANAETSSNGASPASQITVNILQ